MKRRDRCNSNMSQMLHKYIHKKNKTLPIQVTSVATPIRTRVSRRFTIARKPWPVLHLSKWIQTCFDTPEFNGFFLLGGKTMDQLSEVESMFSRFWSRYKYMDANTPACPERTIPIYLHGDEGRGLVKRPLLILSFQPIIGWGGEGHANTVKPQHLCITSLMISRLYVWSLKIL